MRTGHVEDRGGGYPLLGEPLAIEFVNTVFASRGVVRDGLTTTRHLGHWLRDHVEQLGDPGLADRELSQDALRRARRLRDAIRGIAAALVADQVAPERHVAVLNQQSRQAPRYPQLDAHTYAATEHTTGRDIDSALGAIARSAIALFASDARDKLRACHGPGCVLYFVKDHPRREWCSDSCGNRARAARHYQRHRNG